MKKIFFFIMLVMFAPLCVMAAENHVYSIDMSIYIDETGTAHITEIWEVQAAKGKDWCKIFSNLENVELDDISVLMDEDLAEHDEDVKTKKPRYELKYVPGGKQLCFGYNDTNKHTFMLSYEVQNYIVETGDSQVLYHVLAENVTADEFYADIVTYYRLPDDLDFRAPDFVGSAYVSDGRIVVANFDGIKDQYVTVLAKFPLKTFSKTSKNKEFKDFNDALEHSENGEYVYPDYSRISRFTFLDFIFILLSIFVVLLIVEFIVRKVTGKSILKHEKVKRILDKITPVFKKIFKGIKNLFNKIVNAVKKIFRKKKNNM